MLHNWKTIRILYDNMHTFEKLMSAAFEQNQVWHNQMMKSCHIMSSGAQNKSVV